MFTNNTGLGSGKKTCDGTVEKFFVTETHTRLNRGITLLANSGNSDTVYIGFDSGITEGSNDETDGFPLDAGSSLLIPIRNPNEMWIVGASGDIVHWISN